MMLAACRLVCHESVDEHRTIVGGRGYVVPQGVLNVIANANGKAHSSGEPGQDSLTCYPGVGRRPVTSTVYRVLLFIV